MLDDFQANLPDIDFHRVFITHTGCDEDANYLRDELLKIGPVEEVCITTAGVTVSSHCGPNTIGILYLTK
jgi:fatty acid-binding protein DegV